MNKTLFDELQADQERIHEAFGSKLSWERISDRRASRIAIHREASVNLDDEDEAAAAVAWAVDQAVLFIEVLDQRLRTRAQELKLNLPLEPEMDEDEEQSETAS